MRGRWLLVAIALAGCASPPAPAEPVLDGLPHAALLLWREPYTTILVEVDHAEGRRPSDETLATFVAELEELTQKPVRLVGPRAIDGLDATSFHRRSTEELLALHRATFESHPDPAAWGHGGTAFVHLLFPDGVHEEATAGLAIDHVLVVFKDGLPADVAEQPLWGARGERIVLRHEMGHLLGLVNCGTPMLTPREGDRCHSTRRESVMYAGEASETARHDAEHVLALLTQGERPEPTFDEADRRDLAAYRALVPARRG